MSCCVYERRWTFFTSSMVLSVNRSGNRHVPDDVRICGLGALAAIPTASSPSRPIAAIPRARAGRIPNPAVAAIGAKWVAADSANPTSGTNQDPTLTASCRAPKEYGLESDRGILPGVEGKGASGGTGLVK